MGEKKIRFGISNYTGLIDLGVVSEQFIFVVRMVFEKEYRDKLGGAEKIHGINNEK